MYLNHVGYLVKDIKKAQEEFRDLGFEIGEQVRCEHRKIDVCIVNNNGYRVELISPYSEDSVVSNLLEKKGNTPYHLCFETADIMQEIHELRKRKFMPIGRVEPAIGMGGRNVVFLIHNEIGMIELVEVRGNNPDKEE